MKKTILLLLLIFAGVQQLSAKISVGTEEKIKVVYEFPNTEDYMTNPGRWVDLGIKYEAFVIAGAPLWVSEDPIFVGVENNNTDFYLDLTDSEVELLLAEHKLKKEDLLSLSFMDKHAGLIFAGIGIIAILLYLRFFGPKDEDEIETIEKPVS